QRRQAEAISDSSAGETCTTSAHANPRPIRADAQCRYDQLEMLHDALLVQHGRGRRLSDDLMLGRNGRGGRMAASRLITKRWLLPAISPPELQVQVLILRQVL